MTEDTRFTAEVLREELAKITVRGSERAGSPVSLEEARELVARMIEDDAAPEWRAILRGREDFARIVRLVRDREEVAR